MRVLKLVLLAGLVGAAGYVAWARALRPPEKRACARLRSLCDDQRKDIASDDKEGDCDEFFGALKRNAHDAFARTTTCVNESRSCGQAVGCMAGGGIRLGTGFARDFVDGLDKSLGH